MESHVRDEDGHATLDLHGLSQDLAQRALAAFLSAARREALSPVRVIHGVGHGSGGKPVLKGLVEELLDGALADEVDDVRAAPGHVDVQVALRLPWDLPGLLERASLPRHLPGHRTDLVHRFAETFLDLVDGGEVPPSALEPTLDRFLATAAPAERAALERAGLGAALERAFAEESGLAGDDLPAAPARPPPGSRRPDAIPAPAPVRVRPPRTLGKEESARPSRPAVRPAAAPPTPLPSADPGDAAPTPSGSPVDPADLASSGIGPPLAWALLALMASLLPGTGPFLGAAAGGAAAWAVRPSRPGAVAAVLCVALGGIAGGAASGAGPAWAWAAGAGLAAALVNRRCEMDA
ncbi:Smr/MutS family protein [Myxococcota bacterium]|nr:Smr/MutS family protein [Myxococcota bacterium]